MEKDENKYLPYGSVVKLKDDGRLYMIVGLQVEVKNSKNNSEYYFDYSSIVLPKGYIGEEEMVLFNADSIGKVVFKGYMNKKISTYYEDVKWEVDRREKDGK